MVSQHIEIKFDDEQMKRIIEQMEVVKKEARHINKLLMTAFILHIVSFGLHIFNNL